MINCKSCIYYHKEDHICFRTIEIPVKVSPYDSCPYGKEKTNRLTNDFIYNDGNVRKDVTTLTFEEIYNRLYELENKEEKKELIFLPCPIGSTIYSVYCRRNYFVKKGVLTYYNLERVLNEFGHTVFTIEEDASDLCKTLNDYKNSMSINYCVDDYGVMKIYDHNALIVEIPECENSTKEELEGILYDEVNDSIYLNNKYGRKAVLDYLKRLKNNYEEE